MHRDEDEGVDVGRCNVASSGLEHKGWGTWLRCSGPQGRRGGQGTHGDEDVDVGVGVGVDIDVDVNDVGVDADHDADVDVNEKKKIDPSRIVRVILAQGPC